MTTNDLIARYNDLARKAGLPELTEGKKSKAELEARIPSIPADPLDMDEPEPAAGPSAPEAKPRVAAIVAELLADKAVGCAWVAEEVRRRVPDTRGPARSRWPPSPCSYARPGRSSPPVRGPCLSLGRDSQSLLPPLATIPRD